MKYDSIIVGGGMAGLTAAAYLARANKTVLLFEKQAKVGGLVQTFHRDQVYFDAGLRSIENSGIVFPMLRQLGIDLDFQRSIVSIGIADEVIRVDDAQSIDRYEQFLCSQFPDNVQDVASIVREIRKIMGYMDVLYGIANPAFLDISKDRQYFLKVVLPWMFKFISTIGKINRLNQPVEEYLERFTTNRSLIDIIAQHFFTKTPASFALSYFSLYLDYFYPKGGTARLAESLESYIVGHGGVIRTNQSVLSVNPEERFVIDDQGKRTDYRSLIWAADMKQLYNCVGTEDLKDKRIFQSVIQKRSDLKDLRGGDSVLTVYLTVDLDKEYFAQKCTGHFFYTPDRRGLSTASKDILGRLAHAGNAATGDDGLKEKLKEYLEEYFRLNTFEIAIPVLRDESLAPQGKTGLAISLLFDYHLARKIEESGWTAEMKEFMEQLTIEILDSTIFKGFKGKVSACFSSTPLTIEKLTGNTEGGITGWAFTNPFIPAVSSMLKVAKSVATPFPFVFQAGQWVYSPSGLPISILTGKLASDKALRAIRK